MKTFPFRGMGFEQNTVHTRPVKCKLVDSPRTDCFWLSSLAAIATRFRGRASSPTTAGGGSSEAPGVEARLDTRKFFLYSKVAQFLTKTIAEFIKNPVILA